MGRDAITLTACNRPRRTAIGECRSSPTATRHRNTVERFSKPFWQNSVQRAERFEKPFYLAVASNS